MTVGSGIALAKKTASLISDKKEVKYYGRFGTAMIRLKDKEIEFVGARRESYEPSSRKPMVEDGTLEDDQNRRDFTINTITEQVELMAGAGIDYIQLMDQNHGGTSYFCYSKKHNHPPHKTRAPHQVGCSTFSS